MLITATYSVVRFTESLINKGNLTLPKCLNWKCLRLIVLNICPVLSENKIMKRHFFAIVQATTTKFSRRRET